MAFKLSKADLARRDGYVADLQKAVGELEDKVNAYNVRQLDRKLNPTKGNTVTDITNTHLEAAFIDQIVAGVFRDKPYAFLAVVTEKGWQLGVAVANEQGYNPIAKIFEDEGEARHWARRLNEHIGRDEDSVFAIVSSSMRGNRVEVV